MLPTMTDSPLTWARYYRALGWIPLPIASRRDVPDEAEHATRAKRPMVLWGGGRWIAQPPTDEQLVEWWGEDDGRGIFLLTGPGSGLTVIDVDTYKGGDASPWEPLATVVANTARGGVHLYFAEHPTAKTDNDQRAPGVDIRGKGGGVVAPSGTGSGRSFVRFELPLAPYPAPAPTSKPTAPPTMSTGGPTLIFKPDPTKAGSFAEVVSTTRPDGTKNASAKEIVGMLCRRAALPADALAAALGLLDGANEEELLRPAWEAALSAPMVRPKSFVVQFIRAWNSLRCDPPWEDHKAEAVAESLWRTASSSETTTPNAVAPTEQAEPLARVAVETPPPPPGDDLDLLFPRASKCRDSASIARDRHGKKLSCEKLPPNLNERGFLDDSLPFGTGLGKWLNDALGGGIRPRYFGLLVAKRHKAGKTAFMDQLLTGLTMQGAQHYLDAKAGKPSGPIIQVWTLTEMPSTELEDRGICRYIGCPQDALAAGDSTVTLPWVIEAAARAGISPGAMTEQIFNRAYSAVDTDSLFKISRELRRYVPTEVFPAENRTTGEKSCQEGVLLLRKLAEYIAYDRARLADDAGVPVSAVWPVLFIDPVHRFIDASSGEIAGVDAMVKELRQMANGRASDGSDAMIVFCTADTNKASAGEGKPLKATEVVSASAMVTRAVRGTQSLCHLPNAGMLLETTPINGPGNGPMKWRATIHLGFSRGSAVTEDAFPFDYEPASGRFTAIEPPPKPVPAQVAHTASADSPGGAALSFTPPEKPKRGAAGRAAVAKKTKPQLAQEEVSTT